MKHGSNLHRPGILMNKKFWIIIYLAVLAADLFAVYSNNEAARYVTKPLLMPLLVVYFGFSTNPVTSSLKKWILLALLFSWAGDVFLMFESMNDFFFIFGLAAFLAAHIFYIIFFTLIRNKENVTSKWGFIVLVICYYLFLMDLLQPHLESMKLPVRIYGLVLMLMFYAALLMGFVKKRDFGILIIIGASLFVLSDSLLAINKFYKQFEYAGIAIMFSYGVAQLLITLGAVLYISSVSKQ